MREDWLPPMQAIRAFVAAVRTRSFARAGEDLQLTHGAVSHHVAQIEHLVGARLFERRRRGVTPTPEAVLLADRLGRSLSELRAALAKARRGSRPMLTVTMTPAFAQRWLLPVPRLGEFQAEHPDIDLRLCPTATLLDLDTAGVDLAIRYGPGGWEGLEAVRLADETIFPVVGPSFRDGRLPQAPADLLGCTLIRNPRQPWAPWLRAAGLPAVEPSAGPMIEDAGLALDLAVRGQGIALAHRALAAADLEAGRLVRLFPPIEVKDAFAYHLVWRSGSGRRPAAQAFAAWIGVRLAAGAV
jgi:DNA-binding transcriptional LysR family regulator